jgi:peptidyl-prolyl cis-trans isomerase C
MMKLEKGKYTETPVQSQFGWHVIQLDDVRPAKFPDFNEVKPGLQQRLQEAMFEKAVADLRAKAKVE